ncbi:MAG: hypothetical protein ABW104_18070 [Candidatus Thiodiazotropha sp. 6PLUC2]|nr:hypothetical protein [Candidatus Thiodiazotropha lotti]MCW4218797.1 hypothetical protein [Candidatus Thiodiazotropha lotti]
MASTHPNVVLCEQQPSNIAPRTCEAPRISDPDMLLHMMESLPMLSQDIVDLFSEGEALETIQRKVDILHHNLGEFSRQAKDFPQARVLSVDLHSIQILSQEIVNIFSACSECKAYGSIQIKVDILHHNLGELAKKAKGLQSSRS